MNKKIFVLVLAALMLASLAYAIKAERVIDASVEAGDTIDIKIEVGLDGENPSSLIVTETIPAGWEVVNSKPNATAFDGKIKWLVYGSSLKQKTTLEYTLKAPANFSGMQEIKGTWKTLTGAGSISGAFAITETAALAAEGQDNTLLIIGAVVVVIGIAIAAYYIKKK